MSNLSEGQSSPKKSTKNSRNKIIALVVVLGLGGAVAYYGKFTGKASGEEEIVGCGGQMDPGVSSSHQALQQEHPYKGLNPDTPKNILFVSHKAPRSEQWLDPTVEHKLESLGYNVSWFNTWSDGSETKPPKDLLKDIIRYTPNGPWKFHVIVLWSLNLSDLNAGKKMPIASLLKEFVDDGGGLFITKDHYLKNSSDVWNDLLSKINGSNPNAPPEIETLGICDTDANNLHKQKTGLDLRYVWTSKFNTNWVGPTKEFNQISDGLYFPLTFVEPFEPSTVSVEIGNNSDWECLLEGSTSSYPFDPTKQAPTICKKASPSPCLIAIRDKISSTSSHGRVVLWPMEIAWTFLDGYSPLIEEGVTMGNSKTANSSQGAAILYSLLDWLTAPSTPKADAGIESKFLGNPFVWEQAPPVFQEEMNWNEYTNDTPDSSRKLFKGLIGARSGFDPGLIKDFIEESVNAGYQFLVFTEDYEKTTPKNWGDLKSACANESANHSNNFQAFPGFRYKDFNGVEFVVLGLNHDDPKQLIQSVKTHPNRTLHKNTDQTAPIVMLPPKIPDQKLLRLAPAFHGYAIQYTNAGETIVDQDWDTYINMQKEGHKLFPAAVHIMTHPEQVSKIAEDEDLMQTYIRADKLENVLKAVSFRNPTKARREGFISQGPTGPEIKFFETWNRGSADLNVLGRNRIRTRLGVSSNDAQHQIAAVEIYDNGRLYRRFLPNQTEFKRIIDDYHNQQHSFVMKVEDSDGKKAISWAVNTNVKQFNKIMCGDNLNEMGNTFGNLDNGVIQFRGTEFDHSFSPAGTMKVFPGLFPLGAQSHLKKTDAGVEEIKAGQDHQFATKWDCDLVSRFGSVCTASLNHIAKSTCFTTPGGAFHDCSPGEEDFFKNNYYKGQVKHFSFTRRPPEPYRSFLKYQIQFIPPDPNATVHKTDYTFTESPGLSLASFVDLEIPEGFLDHYLVSNGSKEKKCTYVDLSDAQCEHAPGKAWRGDLDPKDYVLIYEPGQGIMSLDSDLRFRISPATEKNSPELHRNVLALGIGKNKQSPPVGSFEKNIAMAWLPETALGDDYSWAPSKHPPTDASGTDDSSIAGLKTWRKEIIEYNANNDFTIKDGMLHLKPDEHEYGLLKAFEQQDLMVPTLIHDLNPNWSAGVWYVGEAVRYETQLPLNYLIGEPETPEEGWKFVQELKEKDKIIHIGTILDDIDDAKATGFLQLDLTSGPKEIFIGNFVIAPKNKDVHLVFHMDCESVNGQTQYKGGPCVQIHNPTKKDLDVTVENHPGFTRLGSFSKSPAVKAGDTIVLPLPDP